MKTPATPARREPESDRFATSHRAIGTGTGRHTYLHDLRKGSATAGWPAAFLILKATEQPIDTSTAAGKCFLDMLGVFAEVPANPDRSLEETAAVAASPHEKTFREFLSDATPQGPLV